MNIYPSSAQVCKRVKKRIEVISYTYILYTVELPLHAHTTPSARQTVTRASRADPDQRGREIKGEKK